MATGPGPGSGNLETWSEEVDRTEREQNTLPVHLDPTRGNKKSFASVLGSNLPVRDNKNVLEVVLEKDTRGSFIVTEQECAHMMKKLGLDQRPGVHVEEVQICPQGRGVIFITLKEEIEIEKFCRYDVLEVTRSGTRAVIVKPAVKKEVVVTVRGLHPNTKDAAVLDYLGKFGEITNNKVVYGVYNDGPLKGLKNGDRSYQLVVKPETNVGSYHFIDNQKVSLRYPGQQQTCARCYSSARQCRGRGVARKCEEAGGTKVEFTEYILNLWKTIGYSPNVSVQGDSNTNSPDIIAQQAGGVFTPKKGPEVATLSFTGVSIRQFPRGTDQGVIVEFLVNSGLPESKKESITFTTNGGVMIKDLENRHCKELIEVIHGKKHFGQKMFCNGFIPLTPEKNTDQVISETSPVEPEKLLPQNGLPGKPLPLLLQESPVQQPGSAVTGSSSGDTEKLLPLPGLTVEPLPPLPQQPGTAAEKTSPEIAFHRVFTGFESFPSDKEVIRRHSISLTDRTPPPNSIAADILGKHSTLTAAKTILAQIADMKESLSDFNSCVESPPGSSSSSDDNDDDLKEKYTLNHMNMNDKKREKKRKRRSVQTPSKEDFLVKKANTQKTPQ